MGKKKKTASDIHFIIFMLSRNFKLFIFAVSLHQTGLFNDSTFSRTGVSVTKTSRWQANS